MAIISTEQNKIAVIGNGSWGTALTKILTDNGNQVYWWMRKEEDVAFLKSNHHNHHYLPTVKFDMGLVSPHYVLETILEQADTVVIAVPSAYITGVLDLVTPQTLANKTVVSAIKGILPSLNVLLSEYLIQELKFDINKYVAITGPCHAEEVAEERLSYLTFSGLNKTLTESVAKNFTNSYLFTSCNNDIWGAQFAAVMKNIYAIGAGMAKALGYGDNFMSVYITNCYREMYHFLKAHFYKVHPQTNRPDFHTSTYLGDLLVTCYSMHSRNRTLGTMLGRGYSVKAAFLEMNMVAEGYFASKGMHTISRELEIPLPIAGLLYNIMYEQKPPALVFQEIEKMLS